MKTALLDIHCRLKEDLMYRALNASIRWEIFELFLLILFVCSWIVMVCHSYTRKKPDVASLRDFLERYSVLDYIGITRSETGSIGKWFWVFVVSFVLIIAIGVQSLCVDFYAGTVTKLEGDYLWPIL